MKEFYLIPTIAIIYDEGFSYREYTFTIYWLNFSKSWWKLEYK